ncbi:MAG: hypothetical protein V4539_01915 [Bacteroidota bacterium]
MKPLYKYSIAVCLSILAMAACSKPDETPAPAPPVTPRVVPPVTPTPVTTISSFLPQVATAADMLRINGKNFTGCTGVMIGNAAAKSFQVASDTVIIAYVATTSVSSGKISVTTPLGTAEASGFTYYTPVSYSLSGTTRYGALDKFYSTPVGGGYEDDSSSYKSYDRIENCTVTIRHINSNDIDRNASSTGFFGYYTRSRFVDSPNYVIISGVINEGTAGITGVVYGQAYKFTNAGPEWSSVFAKIEGSVITIPKQFPLNGYVYMSGSGELKNGVLKLNYFMDDTRGNSKTGSLTSQ